MLAKQIISTAAPIPSTGDVDNEKLNYDNLTKSKKSTDISAPTIKTINTGKKSNDNVVAAFSAQFTEDNKQSNEAAKSEITNEHLNKSKASADGASVLSVLSVSAKSSTDLHGIDILLSDQSKESLENISNTVLNVNASQGSKALDYNEVQISAKTYQSIKASDLNNVDANYAGYVDAVVSFIAYSPSSAVIGDTGSSADISATSSGIAGTTSNTVNGELVLGFKNPSAVIGDLSLNGNVTIEIEKEVLLDGTTITGRTYSIIYQYKTTGSYLEFARDEGTTDVTKAFSSTSLPGLVLSDIDSLMIKVIGTVTSGTGLSSSVSSKIYRARVIFNSTKEY